MNHWLSCCQDVDRDPTNFGRWVSICIIVNQNIKTRIIAVYRPVKSYLNKATSVYVQHEQYFRQQGINNDPLDMFNSDLTKSINKYKSKG